MTAIKIKGAGYPIRKVFSDDFVFNIPNYQRPYAWTTTILFAVLRELLPEYKNDLEDLICQPEKLLTGTPARPRLILRERDRNFFEEYIQHSDGIKKLQQIYLGGLTDSQRNIVENTRFLLKAITNELPTESQKLRLTQFLLQRCYLVVVYTPDFDSAYKIFSVLNDRGLDLSITDILKADVIGKFSQQEYISDCEKTKAEAKYTRKWEELEEQLGRKDFTDLFSYIRMIYAKKKLETTVLKSFRIHVLEREENKNPCDLINKVLEPYAKALYDLKNFTFVSDHYSQEINQLFRWLQKIDHFDWIAPAILYLKKYRHEPEKLLRFFTDLERLAAGLMIKRAKITERISRYANIIRLMEQNSDLLYAYDSPIQLTKQEQQEIITLLDGDIYNKYKTRSIRVYILLRLDSAISDGIPNYDSHKKITIEHVLPQNPKSDSEWTNWFSTEEEREKYLHRLGNLVLLSRQKNSQAGNYDFATKKEKYFNNPVATFALTVQVLKEQKWTAEIVEARQKYLLEELKKIWQLNNTSI